MENQFQITGSTPIAALNVSQFTDLIKNVISSENQPENVQPVNDLPEVIGKKQCAELTGYAVNTINKLICEKRIPYYKLGEAGTKGKVRFKRDEIRAWMTGNRIETASEFVQRNDLNLKSRRK
jgi:excisionase family DNA binding protein